MRSKNNTTLLSTTYVCVAWAWLRWYNYDYHTLWYKFSRRLNSEGSLQGCDTSDHSTCHLAALFFFFCSVFTFPQYKLVKCRKKNFFFFALLILFMHIFIVSRFVVHTLFALCICAIIIIAAVNNCIKNIHIFEIQIL